MTVYARAVAVALVILPAGLDLFAVWITGRATNYPRRAAAKVFMPGRE